MKTQISVLPEKPCQTEIYTVWEKVKSENKTGITVNIRNIGAVKMFAQWSLNNKNVCFYSFISPEKFAELTGKKHVKQTRPDIRILSPTSILVFDGSQVVKRLSHKEIEIL